MERLDSMAPGGDLALVLEEVVSHLLVAVDPREVGSDKAADVALLPDPLDPVERSLVDSAGRWFLDASAAGGAGAITALGAEAVSALMAAASRMKAWASWAEAVLAALLARTDDMSGRAWGWDGTSALPGGGVNHEGRMLNTTGEVACRLGVSRTRATQVVERGEALLGGMLSRTECLHRAGLIDEAKTALVTRRLSGEHADTALAVQERVLPRAAHRTHSQLAKDVDRALAALDPEGACTRRRRNEDARHVSRPRPAGQGVSLVKMLLPTPDAFLLDATLDAIAASARCAGDQRTLGQLRADALTSMAVVTLRSSHAAAAATSSTALANATSAETATQPEATNATQPEATNVMDLTTACAAGAAHAVGAERTLGTVNTVGAERAAGGADGIIAVDTWPGVARQPVLLADGVPLESLLASLSALMSSTGPWWSPSGHDPVYPPPGLTVRVDVTVPLDHLVEPLNVPATSPPTAEGNSTLRNVTPGDGIPGSSAPDLLLAPQASVPASGGASASISPPPGGTSASSATSASTNPPAGVAEEASLTVGGRRASVPTAVALALAAGGTWRRVVTDPLSGTVVDVGRTRYRPPAALADLVRARDASCTHPGCEVPASRCDIDHVQAWAEGGTTSLDNLTCLCQAHHCLKHTPGWSLTRTSEGVLTWRTPTGARYERRPDGSVHRLPQRTGPRGLTRPGGRLPAILERALSAPVLARLEKGLALASAASTAGTARTQGRDRRPATAQPLLESRGPRPGEHAGAYEPVPYDHALHILGLAPLLDEVPPF